MKPIEIAIRYTACAAASTLFNLTAQWSTFRLHSGVGDLTVGLATGTAVGLVSKYLLDKFLIFDDQSMVLAENIHKFSYYCITGAFTTAIFWGTETAFALVGERESMRYVGAVIGLSIGYLTKYHLDRRFVFQVRS